MGDAGGQRRRTDGGPGSRGRGEQVEGEGVGEGLCGRTSPRDLGATLRKEDGGPRILCPLYPPLFERDLRLNRGFAGSFHSFLSFPPSPLSQSSLPSTVTRSLACWRLDTRRVRPSSSLPRYLGTSDHGRVSTLPSGRTTGKESVGEGGDGRPERAGGTVSRLPRPRSGTSLGNKKKSRGGSSSSRPTM